MLQKAKKMTLCSEAARGPCRYLRTGHRPITDKVLVEAAAWASRPRQSGVRRDLLDAVARHGHHRSGRRDRRPARPPGMPVTCRCGRRAGCAAG